MTLKLSDIDPVYFKRKDGLRYEFLNEAQIRKFCKEPDNDMSEKFINEALSHGEECFAALDGDKLANYAWYSDRPSHARRDIYFYFNNDHKYRHKAFTNKNYRGKSLNVINKVKACEYYTEKGYKGLLSIVEAHNFNSLRSNNKVNTYSNGNIYIIMLFNKYFSFADRKAKKMGCFFAPKDC